jgi:EpsI family protein
VDTQEDLATPLAGDVEPGGGAGMTKLGVALAFLALNFYTYHYFASDAIIPPRQTFDSFPLEIGDWKCGEPESMTKPTLENLGVTDYLICSYEHRETGASIGVYVGYYESQVRQSGGGGESVSHPPEHCLPGSGWAMIDMKTVELDFEGLPGGAGPARRFIIAKGRARQLVYFWYQERGRVMESVWKQRLAIFWDRATKHRTDGALVRFTVPLGLYDEERSEADFRALAPQVVALLPDYLPE